MSRSLVLLSRGYDRTSALFDGRVALPEGVRCEIAAAPIDCFRRLASEDDLLAGEMSFSFQVAAALAQEPSRFLALPVFLSRSFRHGNIFVRGDSPLTKLSDLKGRRVGLEEYAMTMAVWVRALLRDAGVNSEDIEWFTARTPIVVPQVESALKGRLRIARASAPVFTLLQQGAIDAAIGRPPNLQDLASGSIRRLLGDHWAQQRDYFKRTGIFPAMHVLVVRRDEYEMRPGLATELYDAFLRAKQLQLSEMRTNLNSLISTLPMLEAHIDDTASVFGDDWWPYGIAANRTMIEAFFEYCYDQAVTPRRATVEDVFCPILLDR